MARFLIFPERFARGGRISGMRNKLLTVAALAVVVIAWMPARQLANLFAPKLFVEPVYDHGAVVACQHYYSVPLKAGGEFRYQWQPEFDAFLATNGAALQFPRPTNRGAMGRGPISP